MLSQSRLAVCQTVCHLWISKNSGGDTQTPHTGDLPPDLHGEGRSHVVKTENDTTCGRFPFTVFLVFQNGYRWGKRKINCFPHFVRRKEYRNRFINLTSHFVLKAVIGKTEYGFVFLFPWYRTEWGKQINGIYTHAVYHPVRICFPQLFPMSSSKTNWR